MNCGRPNMLDENMIVLNQTFLRLRSFYERAGLIPGKLDRIGLKPGWTVVIGSNEECGTAFRFSGPHKVYENNDIASETLQSLIGKGLFDVAGEHLSSQQIPLRSLAVAALSALSQPFLSSASLSARKLQVINDRDILETIVIPEDIVTLVGYGGMAQRLLGKCRELHVADMRSPEALLTKIIGKKIEYAPKELILHGAEDDEEILGKSDVVIITASSLVNGTIDELLRYSINARAIVLYGPSASILPDVLFEKGVDFVMSHHVHSPKDFIYSMHTDQNMEQAIRNLQHHQTIYPEAGPEFRR